MNSDVIRVFNNRYQQRPSVEEILNDTAECYLHTSVSFGVKSGSWIRVGYSDNLGSLDIWFRSSKDMGKYPGQSIISYNWEVWRMNEPREFVGKLPERYYTADIGLLDPPQLIIERIIYLSEYLASPLGITSLKSSGLR